jgi:hypothetical protein
MRQAKNQRETGTKESCGLLRGLFFDTEEGGDMFHRNFF